MSKEVWLNSKGDEVKPGDKVTIEVTLGDFIGGLVRMTIEGESGGVYIDPAKLGLVRQLQN